MDLSLLYHDFDKELASIREEFQVSLMQTINDKEEQTNMIISPFGIHVLLTIILAGSNGTTREQLWNVLG